VRGAAVWALSRLLGEKDFAGLARERGDDPDPDVRAEWAVSP
jgi:epoxyqueuosine reductase